MLQMFESVIVVVYVLGVTSLPTPGFFHARPECAQSRLTQARGNAAGLLRRGWAVANRTRVLRCQFGPSVESVRTFAWAASRYPVLVGDG